ncbi:MAG: EF-hand domain-containing protein [Myxococcales bacterium]|nr:EF-hand domain-containing protein [Myxococcales bacterium]
MNRLNHCILRALALLFAISSPALAKDEPITYNAPDGLKIDGMLGRPSGKSERVIVLLAGSGAYDMNLDLTVASKDKKTKILWLKDISDALVKQGFTTLRFNKRPYQIGTTIISAARKAKRKLTPAERKIVDAFVANPVKYYVEDAKGLARLARATFPKAKIYFLGGSEGTNVAMWAAHELKWIAGVANIGFYSQPLMVLTYIQAVLRPAYLFQLMDRDGDGWVTKAEMEQTKHPIAAALLAQLKVLDADGDGKLSRNEYLGMILANKLVRKRWSTRYTVQELRYPKMATVLKAATYKVAFFSGLWDNQTPAYHTMAIELLAKNAWGKKNFKFWYFPKLGHCLDPRSSSHDLYYQPIDRNALNTLATGLNAFFD